MWSKTWAFTHRCYRHLHAKTESENKYYYKARPEAVVYSKRYDFCTNAFFTQTLQLTPEEEQSSWPRLCSRPRSETLSRALRSAVPGRPRPGWAKSEERIELRRIELSSRSSALAQEAPRDSVARLPPALAFAGAMNGKVLEAPESTGKKKRRLGIK